MCFKIGSTLLNQIEAYHHEYNWAPSWQNQQCGCAPSKDSAQSDQSLRCPHEESLGP